MIEYIFERFCEYIYYFPKIQCHIVWLLRSDGLFNFNFFNENVIATSLEPQMLYKSFGLFSEAWLKMPQLLPTF